MSFLIITDIHFKKDNKLQTDLMQERIFELLSNTDNIKYIIINGDTFNDFDRINLFVLNRITEFFSSLLIYDIELFINVGNHERPNPRSYNIDDHPLNSLKKWSKTHIIDIPQIFERENISFCIVPYIQDGFFIKYLEEYNINIEEIDVFFSHSDFTGSSINKISKT